MNRAKLIDFNSTKAVVFENIRAPHGCSTRVGGVSGDFLSSLNTGFTVGDQISNVWENRRRFSELLGVENLPWLLSMTHGKVVVRVDEAPPILINGEEKPRNFYPADGCITNVPGVPLSLTVADCVPVFFHDPVQKAVGVTHAGWRGTVAGIVSETVLALQENYQCDPKNVQVGIGPSIGPDAFEVGSEVLAEFKKAFPESETIVLEHTQASAREQGKGYVNLWEANRQMALRAGVPEDNIQISHWCTVSHPELFFSHRRDEGKSGRLLAGIILPS